MAERIGNAFGLTDRQKQVVELAVMGLTNAEIAERCGIHYATVIHHWRLIRMKIKTHNKAETVKIVREHAMALESSSPAGR
jgi:DNA-binding CsgD family transcriptional regulator